MTAAAEFVGRCFAARTAAHIYHLKTRSYAAHVALEEFYDGIIDLADAFAECWQGQYGLLKDIPTTGPALPAGPLAYVDGFVSWVAKNRYDITPKEDTTSQNMIDEIVALARRTLYKLTFLS